MPTYSWSRLIKIQTFFLFSANFQITFCIATSTRQTGGVGWSDVRAWFSNSSEHGYMCENSWQPSPAADPALYELWPPGTDPAVTAVYYETVKHRLKTFSFSRLKRTVPMWQYRERAACIILLTVSELHYWHSSHSSSKNPPGCTAASVCQAKLSQFYLYITHQYHKFATRGLTICTAHHTLRPHRSHLQLLSVTAEKAFTY